MFKLEKLKLDLDLDLTVYLPGEAGKIKAVKTSPEDIFNWLTLVNVMEHDISKLQTDPKIKPEEILPTMRRKIIETIDYLYDKGYEYWTAIPHSDLRKILTYLGEQANDIKKK